MYDLMQRTNQLYEAFRSRYLTEISEKSPELLRSEFDAGMAVREESIKKMYSTSAADWVKRFQSWDYRVCRIYL